MNFFIWSIFESHVSTKSFPKVEVLKDALQKSWAVLDEKLVRDSRLLVARHLKLIVNSKEGYFEI